MTVPAPPVRTAAPAWTVLRRDGVAVVVGHESDGLPTVRHWGADLGPLAEQDLAALDVASARQTAPGTLDAAWRPTLLPQEGDGWTGRPGVLVTRDGAPVFPRWTVSAVQASGATLDVTATADGLTLRTRLEVGAGGLVLLEHALTNDGPGTVEVSWLEATLPVPRRADHLTTFAGRWSREKVPQTAPMPRGSTTRTTRRGRGGHDSPWATLASTGAPQDRSGEVWAVHLGWSADVTHRLDRLTEHTTLLGAGELLRPGEIRLAPGADYRTPVTYFAWSRAGLDGVSDRFHTWLRARPQHPRGPRPLVLNTWEAVYFDHDPQRLAALARRAADVGVERFVLDDGWFHDRRDDTRGLGDWVVDPAVWPQGLEPLAELVHSLRMQLGLWFEPEMVNLDSDLAREHPQWLLHARPLAAPAGVSWRNQHVLDLANPEAWEHVRGLIDDLVGRLGIDFIKWDHNRDLAEPVHDGRPGTHAQTTATYALIARLKADHPGLEIESCSSGGARTDLGILAVTDRVWASDSNDPVERQDVQRWTQLLLPPELVGSHVGPPSAHSSGRTIDLSYRLATALMGSAGFEWDIAGCDEDETAALRRFGALYTQLRPLLHSGTVVHTDPVDAALRTVGVVAADRAEAVFTVATVAGLEEALPEPLRLPALDPDRRYRVRVRDEVGAPKAGWIIPPWLSGGEVTATGRVLGEVGLQLPVLWPFQALVLHLTAV